MNMFNKMFRILVIGVSLFAFACSENPFNPAMIDNISTSTDYDFSTPTKVIENLVRAYEQKNIELFKQCLAEEFRFELIASDADDIGIDMDGDGIKDSWWGYQQEILTHENLFENGSNSYPPPDQISLDIPTGIITWYEDNEYADLGYLHTDVRFNLLLQFNTGQTFSASGYSRYYIVNVGTDVEPHWSIIIWRDNSWL